MFDKNEKINETIVIDGILLKVQPMDTNIPANLLVNHKVGQIELECQLINDGSQKQFSINPEAFSSSKTLTYSLKISSCNFLGLSFLFLRGFEKLQAISFHSIANIQLAHWKTLPILSNLTILEIIHSKGLDEWTQFPNLIYGLETLNIGGNEMGNEGMDRILQWIVNSQSVKTLAALNMERNALTRIPHQLSSLEKLEKIYVEKNPLSNTILSGSFNLSNAVKLVSLASCGISIIEPGAFLGFFFIKKIVLYFTLRARNLFS